MSDSDSDEFKDLRSTGLQKNPESLSLPFLLDSFKWKPIPIHEMIAKNKEELIEIIIEMTKGHNNLIRDIHFFVEIAT